MFRWVWGRSASSSESHRKSSYGDGSPRKNQMVSYLYKSRDLSVTLVFPWLQNVRLVNCTRIYRTKCDSLHNLFKLLVKLQICFNILLQNKIIMYHKIGNASIETRFARFVMRNFESNKLLLR